MRTCIVFLLLVVSAASGAEKAQFWGTWEPVPLLREFWRPVRDTWWACNKKDECGPDSRLRKRCAEFARSHSPDVAIPAIVEDLRQFGSFANELVYLTMMSHWPRNTVLRTLESLRRSPDAGIRSSAELVLEDFTEVDE